MARENNPAGTGKATNASQPTTCSPGSAQVAQGPPRRLQVPAAWSWSQLAGLAAVLGAYAFVGASVVVSLLVVAECIMKLLSGNEMLAGGLPLGPSARW